MLLVIQTYELFQQQAAEPSQLLVDQVVVGKLGQHQVEDQEFQDKVIMAERVAEQHHQVVLEDKVVVAVDIQL